MILDGGNRYDLAGALDLRDVDLGDSNVANLAPVAVFLDRGQALFERGLRIDSAQVVERDTLRAQTLKALLDLRSQYLRAPSSGATDASLGGDDAGLGARGYRLPDRLLALTARVGMRGVDHLNSRGHRCLDERDVARSLDEPVRSKPDPADVHVTELHQVPHS